MCICILYSDDIIFMYMSRSRWFKSYLRQLIFSLKKGKWAVSGVVLCCVVCHLHYLTTFLISSNIHVYVVQSRLCTALLYIYTVKTLVTDPQKSGQPLYSGQSSCPRLTSLQPVGTMKDALTLGSVVDKCSCKTHGSVMVTNTVLTVTIYHI